MAKSSLDFKSVKELSSLIKSKELSPVELLDYHISRIDALEGKLNTFASINIDEAKLLAKASEARAAKGQLLSDIDGIPTSIKDLIAQKGIHKGLDQKQLQIQNLKLTLLKDLGMQEQFFSVNQPQANLGVKRWVIVH